MKKLILFSVLLSIIGCVNNNKIEPNDIVKKCVIDSLEVRMERSTIEINPFIFITPIVVKFYKHEEMTYIKLVILSPMSIKEENCNIYY